MPLGVGELAELQIGSGYRRGAEDSGSPKALGLGERVLDVGYFNVDRDVTRVVGSRPARDGPVRKGKTDCGRRLCRIRMAPIATSRA